MNEREDKMLKIGKQKVKIHRESLIQDASKVMQTLQKRSLLEIEYHDEVGTGLGPTLEFYSLLSQQLRADSSLWRDKVADNSLFPRPVQGDATEVCHKFHLAGLFVAKSICDSRLIDLPISELMWDLLLGKRKTLLDLQKLDTNLFSLYSELQVMANRKQEIDDMQVDPEMRQRLLSQVRSSVSSKFSF